MPDLSRLLNPKSVAIVGASPTPGALGRSVLENLERHDFAGDIHLINPKRDDIDGRACLRSISDLPMGVDAAVLAVPGAVVVETVKALAERGVGAAVIFSAGFAEGGEAGLAAQAELARIAGENGMIIEGPNCLGMTNYVDGVALTFVETPAVALDGPGIGIVSQSGAMAVVLGTTLMSKGLGVSMSISTGNEAASGVEDYVEYLIGEAHTSVIGMIVEQFRKPAQFLALAEKARAAGKQIVLLHPGTSSAARESAATHTGAMAGDWDLMKTKVSRAGVIVAGDLEELGDILDIAARAKPVRAGGTAVLTESGAFKALTLDLAQRIGLHLPALAGETRERMRSAIPDFIPVSNPMDLTAQALVDPDLYRRTLEPLLADEDFSAVVLGIIQTDTETSRRKFPPITSAIESLAPEKPIIFAGMDEGADVPAEYVEHLRGLGVPYFPSPDRAMRALARMEEAAGIDPSSIESEPVHIDVLPGNTPEYLAKKLLAPLNITFPEGGIATDCEEAQRIAEQIGYPVALKAQSASLRHKTEVGGVTLNIADGHELSDAWDRMHEAVAARSPGAVIDGVLVEKMGRAGVELIIGARNDPDWGGVILVGFGGVTAELIHDVRLLLPDLGKDAVIDELRKLKQAARFDGYRGAPPLDIEAVADIVIALGRLLAGTPEVREIDLNPVVVYPAGEGAVALDALIEA